MVESGGYREAVRRIAEARESGAQELSLEKLQLETLPPELAELVNLQVLDLRMNNLAELPERLRQLTSLQIINLSGNCLNVPPDWLKELKNMQKIDLSANELQAVPGFLADLLDIRELNLGFNKIKELPDWLIDLSNLHTLDLSGNEFIKLPKWLGNLTKLQGLYLVGCGLIMLPEWLADLSELKSLDVSNNKLRNLPFWLSKLTNLLSIDIGGNSLHELPNCIADMVNLRAIYAESNHLDILPDLRNLTKLYCIDLKSNNFSTLPRSIGQMIWLAAAAQRSPDIDWVGLRIENNPLPFPYPTLIAPGQPEATANVLAYLRGELDPAFLPDVESITSELNDEEDESPTEIIEQRPAAYRFGSRDGRIDALSESSGPVEPEAAADLLAELLDKARDLQERLATANADPRVRRSVDRLVEALTAEPLRPGLVLSRSRSIEADRDAFDSVEGRAELFPDAIARMNDALLTTRDLLAVYPVVRQIERERLALDIERRHLEPVAQSVGAVANAAALSESVTPMAAAALRAQDEAIAEAPTQAVKAELIADAILVAENFARAVVVAADQADTAVGANLPAETALSVRQAVWTRAIDAAGSVSQRVGTEASNLVERCWHEVRENLPAGVGDVSRIAPLVGLAALLIEIYGPVGVLAGLIPTLKPLVAAIKNLKGRAKPKSETPTPPAPKPDMPPLPSAKKRGSGKARKPRTPKT